MSDHRDELGDSNDDEQLTIRIPNPKVYMARQSLWIGRRGKPRCDHCRLNNLKCDRVLPACNHCSWTTGRECKYTPLPTPAHRGIPRCDRCRLNNLKCDRNLPVCNHCKDDNVTECNYTPKKRRKMASDAQSSSEQYPLVGMDIPPTHSDLPERFDFYGQNIGSAPLIRKQGNMLSSPTSSTTHTIQTGRFTAELPPISQVTASSLPAFAPKRDYRQSLSHSYNPGRSLGYTPWSSLDFAPLPEFMIIRLRSLIAVEFPDSVAFTETLSTFLEGLMPELREISCLSPEAYTDVFRCLSRGEAAKLSPRMREWASYHHLCAGSANFSLIVLPREDLYQADDLTRDACRKKYCSLVDGSSGKEGSQPSAMMDGADLFERLPVRDQIFDIMTYAHISHGNTFEMLKQIRTLGFACVTWPMAEIYTRLCPTCSLQGRYTASHTYEENM